MLLPLMETFLISFTGGLFFRLLHLPLPWLLGPLTAVMIWHLAVGRNVYWPVHLRNCGLVILGYILGSSFALKEGMQVINQFPAMMLAAASTILFSLLTGYIISRLTGISLATGIIGSVPGGLTQMVVLSEDIKDTDLTVVTFMQTIRLLSTVFIVPFLAIHVLTGDVQQAGDINLTRDYINVIDSSWDIMLFGSVILVAAWAASRVKIPTPFLLGPLIVTAALVLAGLQAPHVPSFLVITSQLCIGTYLGLIIKPSSLKNWKKLLPYTLGGSITVVIFSLGVGFLLTHLHTINLISAFLGTSPGGMAEMGITAVLVRADVSLVTAYQLCRLSFILFVMPFLLRKWFGVVLR